MLDALSASRSAARLRGLRSLEVGDQGAELGDLLLGLLDGVGLLVGLLLSAAARVHTTHFESGSFLIGLVSNWAQF